MKNKSYIIMDLQDVCNYWSDSLDGAKDYLIDFWSENDTDDEEFETEADWNKFVKEVRATKTPDALNEFLEGIGYTVFTDEKERQEWLKLGE